MGLLKYALHLMIYVNSETILNNDRFFSPYMRRVIHIIEKNHLTITYEESYPHHRKKSFNNYLFALFSILLDGK